MDTDELYELLSADLTEIKEQVRETNGNVRELQIWRAWTTGAIKALVAVAAIPSLVLTGAILIGLR